MHSDKKPVSAFLMLILILSIAFMAFNLAYQGVVKISLTSDDCAHRRAAGKFFLCGALTTPLFCHLYNKAYECGLKRKTLRWVVFVATVVNIIINAKTFKQY